MAAPFWIKKNKKHIFLKVSPPALWSWRRLTVVNKDRIFSRRTRAAYEKLFENKFGQACVVPCFLQPQHSKCTTILFGANKYAFHGWICSLRFAYNWAFAKFKSMSFLMMRNGKYRAMCFVYVCKYVFYLQHRFKSCGFLCRAHGESFRFVETLKFRLLCLLTRIRLGHTISAYARMFYLLVCSFIVLCAYIALGLTFKTYKKYQKINFNWNCVE